MDILQKAKQIQDEVVALRRDFHRHPELPLEEVRTTNRIYDELTKLGISCRRLEPTGLVAEIVGDKPGKTVMMRADIDALETQEKTDLPYASKIDNVMHACGHDAHTAMMIGAAKILNDMRAELKGKIVLLFQAAEEIGKGAKLAIDQGAVEGVDAGFGMHVSTQMPCGTLNIGSGPVLPSGDFFTIKIKGLAAHGAEPHKGVDATIAAAATVMNLQTIISREIAANNPAVVTVGTLKSGLRMNIISAEAEMTGTVRVFDKEIRKEMPNIIKRIATQTAESFRCTAEVDYNSLIGILVNDEKITNIAKDAALKIVSEDKINPNDFRMAADDFAEFTELFPCTFIMLGVGGTYPMHSDKFMLEEEAFPFGVAMYAQFAVDFLNKTN